MDPLIFFRTRLQNGNAPFYWLDDSDLMQLYHIFKLLKEMFIFGEEGEWRRGKFDCWMDGLAST